MTPLLAFTPLYDPLPALYPGMSEYWLFLVIPLVVAIAVVYKGTRVADIRALPREAGILSAQVLMAMVVAAVLLAGGYALYLRIPIFIH